MTKGRIAISLPWQPPVYSPDLEPIHGSLSPMSSKWHLNRFSRFLQGLQTSPTDGQTDRQAVSWQTNIPTDHATLSVAIALHAMRPKIREANIMARCQKRRVHLAAMPSIKLRTTIVLSTFSDSEFIAETNASSWHTSVHKAIQFIGILWQILAFFWKKSKIFKILFLKFSSRHRSTLLCSNFVMKFGRREIGEIVRYLQAWRQGVAFNTISGKADTRRGKQIICRGSLV